MARRCARLAWATPRGVVPLRASAIPSAAGPYTELLITAQADKVAALQEFKRGLMQGLFPTSAPQEAAE